MRHVFMHYLLLQQETKTAVKVLLFILRKHIAQKKVQKI